MAWTPPSTWSSTVAISATTLNEQVRDNMSYVHSGKPVAVIQYSQGSAYLTASSTFVDVDATNVAFSLNCTTGRVLIMASVHLYTSNAAGAVYLDVSIDGTRQGGSHGLIKHHTASNTTQDAHIQFIKTGLSVGAHEFRLMWATATGGTVRMVSDGNLAVSFCGAEI